MTQRHDLPRTDAARARRRARLRAESVGDWLVFAAFAHLGFALAAYWGCRREDRRVRRRMFERRRRRGFAAPAA